MKQHNQVTFLKRKAMSNVCADARDARVASSVARSDFFCQGSTEKNQQISFFLSMNM